MTKTSVQQFLEKQYTKKQVEIIRRSFGADWFMLILHGAVRAGKTQLNNDMFLWELQRAKANAKREKVKKPMYILAAASSGTLHTNVLQELTNKYGVEFKFDRFGNFHLFGVYVVTSFTATIAGLKSIRGMTSYGAYINEASLANKEVFDEILKRCSGRGARIMADTNPDHPEHWLKTDYIDKADGERILAYRFTIFDNNFLDKRYVENIIATTPSGTMADRGIHGLWTIGEGAIYKDFDHNKHLLSRENIPWPSIQRYIVGVDWGYEHYGTMVVIGVTSDGKYYIVEENAHRNLHIDDWVKIGHQIAEKYGERVPFWCDSARPEYVDALYYAGLNADNAEKSVLPGITEVGTLIKSDRLYALDALSKFKDEINQYVWNKVGDKPIDKDDDVLDGVRYAIYSDKIHNQNAIVA